MYVQAARGSLVPLSLGVLLFAPPGRAAGPPADLTVAARGVLSRHCAGCHGQAQVKGGLREITDLARLIDRGLVVPGKALASPLFRRVHEGEMPPPKKRAAFTDRDRDLLRAWIDAGAPTGQAAVKRLVTETDLFLRAKADLAAQPPRQRRFLRYLTLGHLASRPAGERQAVRHAHAKLVNSLSWHARLTVPHPVGDDGLLWRVDLRHYRWTARVWDRLTARYPYRRWRSAA